MRNFVLILIVLTGTLLSACGGQVDAGITPAANKLTFLFFYTDG